MSNGNGNRLLPANTTLLTPGSPYFRVVDALNLLNSSNIVNAIAALQSSVSTMQTQINTINTDITTINGQITTINSTLGSLQTQINTINTRLTNAGIP